MASYWVRPATHRDLPAVRSLTRRVRREGRQRPWPEGRGGSAAGDGVWVVEAGRGEIVGCCGVEEQGGGAWRVAAWYLAPEWRGFGLGRALLAAAVRHVRQHGGLTLGLALAGSSAEAAWLARDLGFTPQGPGSAEAAEFTLTLAEPA